MRSPTTLPQIARARLGGMASSSGMLEMPLRASRRAIRSPMPGTAANGRSRIGPGMSWGRQTVTPQGLSAAEAIFASTRLVEKPMLAVMCLPIASASAPLMRAAIHSGSRASDAVSRIESSSMPRTSCTGTTVSMALSACLWTSI